MKFFSGNYKFDWYLLGDAKLILAFVLVVDRLELWVLQSQQNLCHLLTRLSEGSYVITGIEREIWRPNTLEAGRVWKLIIRNSKSPNCGKQKNTKKKHNIFHFNLTRPSTYESNHPCPKPAGDSLPSSTGVHITTPHNQILNAYF